VRNPKLIIIAPALEDTVPLRCPRIATLLLWTALLPALNAVAAPRSFTFETALQRLWDLSAIPELRREKLRMASSGAVYPRAKDRSEFLYRDSNGDYVLFEAVGPGCLVRYWSALVEKGTRIKLYLDGNTRPDLDMELEDWFTGQTYPWLAPIVGNPDTSSGGSYSYLPIPYAKGCKVALDRVPSFYQIEALQFGDGGVETFDLRRIESYRAAVEKAITELRQTAAADDQPLKTVSLPAGQTCTLLQAAGPAVITEVRLEFEPLTPALLRQLLIRGFWEDEKDPSVWSPVGDFFIAGFEKKDFVSLPLSSTEKAFCCRFPMPFERSGRLEIVNESEQPVTLRYQVLHRPLERFPENWGRFHARWDRVETRMGEYVQLLRSTGSGKYVGLSLNAQGIRNWMLEGDEVAWVDGELIPSIHGTGTEDYFNGAWYFRNGVFHLPFHGATMLELKPPLGQPARASLYRFHLLDPIDFQERIRLNLEHGQENSMQGSDYSFTVFFYQVEPHRVSFKTLPVAARLQSRAPVFDYLARFKPWQEAVNRKDRDQIIELGLGLLADFQQEGDLNRVRHLTGRALAEAGRVDEAVKVWRSAQDYFGVDHWDTRLCQAKAWLYGGQAGPPPRNLLVVTRISESQSPGHFDPQLWSRMPVATEFRTGFPDPYYDVAADVQTEVRAAYDDKNLYLQAVCWEPRVSELRSGEPSTGYFNHKEDSLVACLDTDLTFESYLMVAVGPGGLVSAGAAKAADVWSGKKKMELSLGGAAVVTPGPDHWRIELSLPLSSLGLMGDLSRRIVGFGLIRVRNAGEKKPEVTMWGRGLVPMLPSEFGFARFE
jgi:hypothetical protein